MSTNGKTLKFRAAKLKGFTVFHPRVHEEESKAKPGKRSVVHTSGSDW